MLGVDDLGARWGTGDYDLDKAAEGREAARAGCCRVSHQAAKQGWCRAGRASV